MENIKDIIEFLNTKAENPKKSVDEIIKTGKKVCGIMPAYVPEEIAYAAGYVPIGIWGGKNDIKKAQGVMPPFCCSIMMSVTENIINGIYDVCDFIVVSSLCDTLKCMGQKFNNINVFQIAHPHNKSVVGAKEFLAEEYNDLKEKIESISNEKITDEKLFEAIKIYDENRKALRHFGKISYKYTNIITPLVRHNVFKSGFFMDRKEHTVIVEKLCSLLEKENICESENSVVITGILADDKKILDIIEKSGFSVAADDIVNESGFAKSKAVLEENPINTLAQMWLDVEGTLFAYDPAKKRAENIINEVKRTNSKGVVFCYMPFCDVDSFDEPIIVKRLKEENIPFIKIDFGMQDTNYSRAATKFEAFNEMLEL